MSVAGPAEIVDLDIARAASCARGPRGQPTLAMIDRLGVDSGCFTGAYVMLCARMWDALEQVTQGAGRDEALVVLRLELILLTEATANERWANRLTTLQRLIVRSLAREVSDRLEADATDSAIASIQNLVLDCVLECCGSAATTLAAEQRIAARVE